MARTSTLTLACALAITCAASSQVTARFADRNAVIGERAVYVIEFTREGEDAKKEVTPPTLPKGDAYDAMYADRRQSSSRQMYIVNGRVQDQMSVTTQLLYYVVPKREGTLTIPAFNCDLGDITVRVPMATLIVEREAPGNKYVDVVVTMKPSHAYIGQPLAIMIEVFSDKQFLNRPEPEMTIPWFQSPPGFVSDAPPPARREDGVVPVAIDGKYYNFSHDSVTRDGRNRWRLAFEREVTPVKSGKVFLDSAIFQGVVAEQVGRDVFGSAVARSTARVVKSSAPIELVVDDVPDAGRPESFTNAVGAYDVQLKAGPAEVKAGDPVTITLTIEGRGLLETIKLPELTGFDGFTRYEPERKIDTPKPSDPKSRRLTVSWLVIPNSNDVKEIPRVAFSWFDVEARLYKTATVGPIPLKILGTVSAAPLVVGANPEATKRDIVVRREILSHKSDFGTMRASGGSPFGAGFWTVILLPVLTLAGTTLFQRRRERLSGDAGLRRKIVASKAASIRLAEAEALLGTEGDFAGPLARAVSGFVADKLGLPPASVSARTVRGQLSMRTIEPATVAEAEALLTDLDARRFSGGAEDRATRQSLLDRARELIKTLDRRLR